MRINATGGDCTGGELLVDRRLLLMGTRVQMAEMPELNFGSIQKC